MSVRKVGNDDVIAAITDAEFFEYNGLRISRPPRVTIGNYSVYVSDFVRKTRLDDVFEIGNHVYQKARWGSFWMGQKTTSEGEPT